MNYLDIWNEHAILREGEVLKVYLDTRKKPTVGIGHLVLKKDNLSLGDTITKEQSRKFFEQDSDIAIKAALIQAKEIGITSDWFIAALISVNFQLGTGWTKKFFTTYPAIVSHDFDKAIANLKRSLWNKQTPVRVNDFIEALERAKDVVNDSIPNDVTAAPIYEEKLNPLQRLAGFFKSLFN